MDGIMSFLQDLDIASLLPEPEAFLKDLEGFVRLVVLIGPLLLLGLGLFCRFMPSETPERGIGFRSRQSMRTAQTWRFAQKLAGTFCTALGGGLSVIMGLISLFFRAEAAMAMVNTAIVCVVIELILTIGLWVLINTLITRAFDKAEK